ncbi:hypothetical protein K438DRAFT_1766810 [Mycena galopus ATCC 62051]|nr:hypothetical protein K438DRAFT_1766810 [Mycena galopus ATCC 62051]
MPKVLRTHQLAPLQTPLLPLQRGMVMRIFPPYRETQESRTRRLRNYPNDSLLDFDTPISVVVWYENNTAPGQVTIYPRDDLRVRLGDHDIAFGDIGFDMDDRRIMVYVSDRGCQSCGGGWAWVQCGWDTPLRTPNSGRFVFSVMQRFQSRGTLWLPEYFKMNAKAANRSIENERDRRDADWEAECAYTPFKFLYEQQYGQFVPDPENADWFTKINPRIAGLLIARESVAKIYQHDHPAIVKYLADAKDFKEDFGHEFSAHDADDGHDQYFNCMAFHAWLAKELKSKCDGNPDKLAEVLSTPLTFTVFNPYNADDFRSDFNDKDFNAKLRGIKRKLEGDAAVNALGPNVLQNFPFGLPFTDVQGYYDARYMQKQLDSMVEHHRQELMDDFDDDDHSAPFIRRPPLWSDAEYARKGLPNTGRTELTFNGTFFYVPVPDE